MRKLFIAIVALFCIGIVFKTTVKAEIIDKSFHLITNESLESEAQIKLMVKNLQQDKVIVDLEHFLPVEYPENLTVFINGSPTSNISVTTEDKYIRLKVNFSPVILFNEEREVTITFRSSHLVKDKYGLKELYIPSVFYSSYNYNITYPNSLGKLNIHSNKSLSSESINDSTSSISFYSENGAYLLWGDSYKLSITNEMILANQLENQSSTQLNIPSNILGQSVDYQNITGADRAFYDSWGNEFIESTLEADEERLVKYQAIIENKISPLNLDKPLSKYNFDIQGVEFLNNAIEGIRAETDKVLQLKLINELIKNSFTPKTQNKIYTTAITNIAEQSALSSFEYCAVYIYIAEKIGLNVNLDYGYLLSSPAPIDILVPHIWCSANLDGSMYLVDPFLEDFSIDVSYLGVYPIDRILFGSWHPIQKNNLALGLNSELAPFKAMLSQDIQDSDDTQSEIALIEVSPTETFSGEPYDLNINLRSDSNKLLRIKSITINNEDVSQNLEHENRFPLLLPLKINQINIYGLREPNFFLNTNKEFVMDLKYNDESLNGVIKYNLKFTPDSRVSLGIIVGLMALFFISLGGLMYFYRRTGLRD
jgi:hypothetical protein